LSPVRSAESRFILSADTSGRCVFYNWDMAVNDFLMMLKQPRAADAPRRVWRDWALVGAMIPAAIIELFVRTDIVWPAFSLIWTLALLPTLLWRRSNPLAAVVVAFGAMVVINIAAAIAGVGEVGLYTMAGYMVLPYSLNRWGSGREAMIGLGVLLTTWLTSVSLNYTGIGDLIGGLLFLLFTAELGAVVRYQANSRAQMLEQARSATRQQLARELHDTVAHHVSAIAIQAQGGRAVVMSSPEVAADVLATIEEEASRALTEMRNMVGALRDDGADDPAALAPQPGVADIGRLADLAQPDSPRIELELNGDLDSLRPAVDTALYRLAQESITNATRHARNATRILVRVAAEEESVRLTVEDDGIHNPPPAGTSGFGLVGMMERVNLLGGSIDVGPNGTRGWIVDAVLPRSGQVA